MASNQMNENSSLFHILWLMLSPSGPAHIWMMSRTKSTCQGSEIFHKFKNSIVLNLQATFTIVVSLVRNCVFAPQGVFVVVVDAVP